MCLRRDNASIPSFYSKEWAGERLTKPGNPSVICIFTSKIAICIKKMLSKPNFGNGKCIHKCLTRLMGSSDILCPRGSVHVSFMPIYEANQGSRAHTTYTLVFPAIHGGESEGSDVCRSSRQASLWRQPCSMENIIRRSGSQQPWKYTYLHSTAR